MQIRCLILIGILITGCANKNTEQLPRTYTQTFITQTAWAVVEINGTIDNFGSAFLIDQERGLFITAKHVTDNMPSGETIRLFFNGNIYQARILRVGVLHDATLLQLIRPFDSNKFPSAYTITQSPPKLGETLRIQGFHIHPRWFIEKQKEDDHIEKPVSTLSEYYHIRNRRTSLVFEELKTNTIDLHARVNFDNPQSQNPYIQNLIAQANTHIRLQVMHYHPILYQGLSGGPVLNSNNEVVGIVTGATDLTKPPYPKDHFIVATPVPALSKLLSEIEEVP